VLRPTYPVKPYPPDHIIVISDEGNDLKNWYVDIGAHVEGNQLLAEVDVPDLQQQLDQARQQATLAQKSYEQAIDTNTRYQDLLKQGVVS